LSKQFLLPFASTFKKIFRQASMSAEPAKKKARTATTPSTLMTVKKEPLDKKSAEVTTAATEAKIEPRQTKAQKTLSDAAVPSSQNTTDIRPTLAQTEKSKPYVTDVSLNRNPYISGEVAWRPWTSSFIDHTLEFLRCTPAPYLDDVSPYVDAVFRDVDDYLKGNARVSAKRRSFGVAFLMPGAASRVSFSSQLLFAVDVTFRVGPIKDSYYNLVCIHLEVS